MDYFFKPEFYNKLCSLYSHERIVKNIETLYKLEKPRGYSTFRESTDWCMEVLEEAGFSDVRRISHKADGVTASFDFVMPPSMLSRILNMHPCMKNAEFYNLVEN